MHLSSKMMSLLGPMPTSEMGELLIIFVAAAYWPFNAHLFLNPLLNDT